MLRALLIVLFSHLVWAQPALVQDVSSGEVGTALDQAVQRATWGQFWGAVMVQRDGELLLCKGYGRARRDSDAPVSADSLVDLASVSKAFTAAAILRLEMAGKLKTSDPIALHLPDVPENKKAITLHHLLSHTSGLGEATSFPREDHRDGVVRAILAAPVAAPPGTVFEYSNAGYFLLAAIIEHVSGTTYDAFVRDEVLRRAGMNSGGWHADPSLDPGMNTDRIAVDQRSGRGWRGVGTAIECPYPLTWGYRGSGGIVTSARAMFAWDRALREDDLLAPPQRTKMFTPGLNDYGYGWIVRDDGAGRIATHSGGVAGFGVWFTRWLDADTSVFVVTNGIHDVKGVHDALVGVLYPETAQGPRVTLRPGLTAIGEHGISKCDQTTPSAAPRGARVVVAFTTPDAPAPYIEIDLPRPGAKALLTQLRAAIKGEPPKSTAFPPIDAAIYTMPYRPRDGVFEVSGPDLRISAMPGTPHADADASARASIIIIDEAKSFWPVIVKMDKGLAADLADQMEQALKP